jgi:predicted nucleotidyltransferase
MHSSPLTREEAIRRLQAAESEIRSLGVERLALFGSVLRNEARVDSDVDVLVEFVPGQKSFDHLLALSDLLEERLERPVEVITTEALSPFLGPRILAEALDVLRAA